MKILVIGLDGASPELLLGDDSLTTLRQLMDVGGYGPLESVIPPTTVPAWLCLATGQDPGSLGVYGPTDRADRSYGMTPSHPDRSGRPAIWEEVARQGKRAIVLGTPPDATAFPPELEAPIRQAWSDAAATPGEAATPDRRALRDRIEEGSRRQFAVARELLRDQPWDYFQIVESGLGRLQRAFWQDQYPAHASHEPGSPFHDVIRDYYRHLDAEIGALVELLTDDAIVLVVSAGGVRTLEGAFGINDWLIREGLLVLREEPKVPTPFEALNVDWERTKAWAKGGDCARLFFNVRGREPRGVVDPADYESLRDDVKARLKGAVDGEGRPIQPLVFKPEEIYREVQGIPPDLIMESRDRALILVGTVGHGAPRPGDPGSALDGCGAFQIGAFILAGSGIPLQGPVEGAHLLDIAPTLLELGEYQVPETMRGRSLASGVLAGAAAPSSGELDDEELIRERLRGLGYIA